jgi:hypothetical protein
MSRTVRAYNSPPLGKTGFIAATQIPAGGGLDYFWRVPAMKGDFNGDGKPDVVTLARDFTSSSWPFSVSVLLSNGDGTFNSAVLTPIQSGYCFEFLVGDVNGDHKDDIIILHTADTSYLLSTMDVLISNGDGTFTSGNSYSLSTNTLAGATLADVNGDGTIDLVVFDQNTISWVDQLNVSIVRTLLGNGDGTFQPPTSVPLGGACGIFTKRGYVVLGDLNGDGLLDAACSGWGGQIIVYLATSSNTYAGVAHYSTIDGHQNGDAFTLGDLNGDSRPDIVAANNGDNTITVYMNNGDGTFQSGFYVPAASAATPSGTVADVGPSAVAIADVSGDGKADLISSNDMSADITIHLGNGDGTFTTPAIGYAVGGGPNTRAVVADFDGDAIPDLIVSDNKFSLVYLKGYGDGTFRAAHNYYSPIPDDGGNSYGLSIASGDFNGDGQFDFVTDNYVNPSVGITVYLSRPDGTLSPGVNYGSGGGYMSVTVADFNQDGKLDVAVADILAGLVRIFSGNGDGTFALGGQFATDSSNNLPEAVVTGDFNHDGYFDLAVLNYGSWSQIQSNYNVAVLLNNHAGGFTLSANYPLSGRPAYVTEIIAADLKGNGNLDLLVPLTDQPAVATFSGNGDGTFQPETDIVVEDTANDIAVADLNQDGKLDLAVTVSPDPGTNGIDVALGNEDGTFQTPQLFPTSLQSQLWDLPLTANVTIADIDGDGKLDFVYTNPEFGTVGVLFGNGDGTFSAPLEWAAGGFAWGIAIADINRDGAPDVVVAGDNFAGVTVLLNANGSAVAPNYSLSPSTSSLDLTGQASANLQLTLSSQQFYSGTVSFACSALPSQMSCAFNPQTVQVNANQQTFTALTISIAAVSTSAATSGRGPNSLLRTLVMTFAVVAVFGIVLGGSGIRRKQTTFMWRMLPLAALLLTSCGGGALQPIQNLGGHPRTYVIQVNATGVDSSTGRSVTKSLSLNVTSR